MRTKFCIFCKKISVILIWIYIRLLIIDIPTFDFLPFGLHYIWPFIFSSAWASYHYLTGVSIWISCSFLKRWTVWSTCPMMSSLKSFLKPERPDPPVATKFPSVRPNAKPLPTNAPSSFVHLEPGTLYQLH